MKVATDLRLNSVPFNVKGDEKQRSRLTESVDSQTTHLTTPASAFDKKTRKTETLSLLSSGIRKIYTLAVAFFKSLKIEKKLQEMYSSIQNLLKGFTQDKPKPFNLEEYVASLPRTIEAGKTMCEQSILKLQKGLQEIKSIPDEKRTFSNTFMAYHDLMVSFDAAERLIRSERLVPDRETEGKLALLDQSIKVKDETFKDVELLKVFISYAESLLKTTDRLSAVEWEYLKGFISSIQEENLPVELTSRWKQLKVDLEDKEGAAFAYIQGDNASKEEDTEGDSLSIITSNLCFMPEVSMFHGGLIPWRQRLEGVAKVFLERDADVLVLQEVYDVHAIGELHKQLKSKYAHFYGNMTPRIFGMSHASLLPSSGLAVISKYPLDNMRFTPFKTVTKEKPSDFDRYNLFGFDRNYGLVDFDVKKGSETQLHLAATHLNPFYSDVEAAQMEEIVEIFKAHEDGHPSMLCGDLNIRSGDMNEAGERVIQQNFTDHYDHAKGSTCVDLADYYFECDQDVQKFLATNPKQSILDRMLLWSPWAKETNYQMTINRGAMKDLNDPKKALSDHDLLEARFSFSKTS